MTTSGRMAGKVTVVTAGYGDIGRADLPAVLRRRRHGRHDRPQERRRGLGHRQGDPDWRRHDRISPLRRRQTGRRSTPCSQEVLRRHPRIDVVIGNAAMVENGAFLDIRPDQWQAHLDLNLTGNFHVGQAAARIMVGQEPIKRPGCDRGVRGKILFNSSWCQDTPWPEGCCYGVAKAGLGADDQGHGPGTGRPWDPREHRGPGHHFGGPVEGLLRNRSEIRPPATAAIPLREFGTPEQCADAFLFLASDESDYITGISLLVDGGASLPRRD